MSELGAGSGSGYPGALDTDNTLESTSTTARADVPNDLASAIIAVQTELGLDPAGSLTDVKTFLQTEHNTNGTHDNSLVAMLAGTQSFTGAKTFTGTNTILEVEATRTDTGGANLFLYRSSDTVADNNAIGQIVFRGRNDNSQDVDYAAIQIISDDVTDTTEDSRMRFVLFSGGSAVVPLILVGADATFAGTLGVTGATTLAGLTASSSSVIDFVLTNAGAEGGLRATHTTDTSGLQVVNVQRALATATTAALAKGIRIAPLVAASATITDWRALSIENNAGGGTVSTSYLATIDTDYFTTGGNTPTMGTNCPGTAGPPDQWIRVKVGATTGWIPVWT